MRLAAASLSLALAACAAAGDGDEGDLVLAVATVTTTTTPPADGQCAHIVATRMSDFKVSEYKGPLSGASLTVRTGEHRVTATAYSQPCNAEPMVSPWVADQQLITFSAGQNALPLNFRKNAIAEIIAQFIDDDTLPLEVRTRTAIGRNGEDVAGPGYALDGWRVSQIALPPAAASETFLFTTEGHGPPYSPRGMAHTPGGLFVFQVSETAQSLWAFDGAGNPQGVWPVQPSPFPATQFTDGLEAIDDDHFVRPVTLVEPVNCDADGNNCQTSALQILTKQAGPSLAITAQILLPASDGFPVGVTPVGADFVVAVLPNSGGTELIRVDAAGTLLAGPTFAPGSNEGIFDDGARIIAVDYTGRLTAYDRDDLERRAGEELSYTIGQDYSTPSLLAWRSRPGNESFIALSGAGRLVAASVAFDGLVDLPVAPGELTNVTGMDYRPGADQLALIKRSGGTPTVRFIDVGTSQFVSSLPLTPGAALPLRARTLAMLQNPEQIATHYRRPNGVVDPALEAMVFLHDLTGALVQALDLRPYGFVRVVSVNYLPASNELLVHAIDVTGTGRLVVTSRQGVPLRSYRTDGVSSLTELAPITTGPLTGELGAVFNQPSEFARLLLP